MINYQDLAEKLVFNVDDSLKFFNNASAAYSAIKRFEKKGFIKKVRNNLYVAINPATNTPFANKYQIGSSINSSSYVSYMTAFEYFGFQDQVKNICYVSSYQRFNAFEFEGVTYKCVPIKVKEGVFTPPYTQKIRVTNVEKTLIDSIKKIGTNVSLEELINCVEFISVLDETRISEYLKAYNVQSLYQKSGYLFSLMNKKFKFSNNFFSAIKKNIKKGVVYLSEDAKFNGIFDKTYKIIVPKWLSEKYKEYEV